MKAHDVQTVTDNRLMVSFDQKRRADRSAGVAKQIAWDTVQNVLVATGHLREGEVIVSVVCTGDGVQYYIEKQ